MTSAKLQRSLGLVLALFAIGFLAILAFPPHWHSKGAGKPAVTAEIGNSSKGESSIQ
jgi:hypothetical protein